MTLRITVETENGPADITEGVQVLYDHVIQSLDWGSGFLTVEDAVPIAKLAEVCGFKGAEEAQRYLVERRREDYRAKRNNELLKQAGLSSGHYREEIWDQSIREAKEKFPMPPGLD